VAACLEGQCHFIDGNTDSKRRAQEVGRALDIMGIGSGRLQFSNISSAEGDKFVLAVEKILEVVKEDER
jgi:F420-non-reducing hydrogenase iron-sulfur subunit